MRGKRVDIGLSVLFLTAVSTAFVWTQPAAAKCVDERGCLTQLCVTPGNLVQVTAIANSTSSGMVLVRVDDVRVVDADAFVVPALGTEIEISDGFNSISSGTKLMALAQEAGNVAWPLFSLSDNGDVECLRGSSASVDLDDAETIVRSGDCTGAPMPAQAASCDDTGSDGCLGASSAAPGILIAFCALAWTRRWRSSCRSA